MIKLKELQIWGFYPHWLQKPLWIYEYKEFELQISLLGPKALLISFQHRLSIRKDK